MARLSRRSFLAGAGTTALGAGLAPGLGRAALPELHDIVVVGGGIAGLAAAWTLQRAGRDVVVLEASSRVGGRIRTFRGDGWLLDAGGSFLTRKGGGPLAELAVELGMIEALVDSPLPVLPVPDGRWLSIDDPAFASSGVLDEPSRRRLQAVLAELRITTAGLSLTDMPGWQIFDRLSVDDWCAQRISPAFASAVAEPLLQGRWGVPGVETSQGLLQWALTHCSRGMGFESLDAGLDSLPLALADALDVRLASPVDTVLASGDWVELRSGSRIWRARKAILATPAGAARTMHAPRTEAEQELLAVRYTPSVHVTAVPRSGWQPPQHLVAPGGVLLPRERSAAVARVCAGTLDPLNSAPERAALGVRLRSSAARRLVQAGDAEVEDQVVPELERLAPGLGGALEELRVDRWDLAFPIWEPGRCSAVAAYRRKARKAASSVLFAGDYASFPGLDGAVEAGRWAADQCLERKKL